MKIKLNDNLNLKGNKYEALSTLLASIPSMKKEDIDKLLKDFIIEQVDYLNKTNQLKMDNTGSLLRYINHHEMDFVDEKKTKLY